MSARRTVWLDEQYGSSGYEAAQTAAVVKPVWCVRHRDGWCATKDGRKHDDAENNVATKCEHFVVLAFPGGRGTADMVRRARAAGVRVMEVV